jgi:hypothetical protein
MRKFSVFSNFRHLTIETENLFLSDLAWLQDFHLALRTIVHNFTIRCKHRRRMRTFKWQSEQFVQCRQCATERPVPWMVHRFIHGAPRGFSESKSATFIPRSSEVLWKVKPHKSGTVNCTAAHCHVTAHCHIMCRKKILILSVEA